MVVERDTVIDVQLERENVYVQTRDTIAHAETRYAAAKATLTRGRLALELRNKDTLIPINAKYKIKYQTDSIPYPVEVPVIQKERYVPWYYKTLFWAALVIIVTNLLGFNIVKLFRP
jgi:hypothetical protein